MYLKHAISGPIGPGLVPIQISTANAIVQGSLLGSALLCSCEQPTRRKQFTVKKTETKEEKQNLTMVKASCYG
jgi:hypothetical protein